MSILIVADTLPSGTRAIDNAGLLLRVVSRDKGNAALTAFALNELVSHESPRGVLIWAGPSAAVATLLDDLIAAVDAGDLIFKVSDNV